MLVTTKQKMYLTMHGLVDKGEIIDIPEDVINDFGKDCFEFVGNVKPKDKEPGNETEPGDKNPSTEIEPVSENETEPSEPEQVDESSDTETVDEIAEETVEETVEEKPAAKGSGRGKKKTDTTEE